MLRILIILLLTPAIPVLHAQVGTIDSLLVEARAHWPQLRQRQAELRAAEAALAAAGKAGGPQVSLGGNYTLAAGGRTINIPIGDLLNPVYGTLNQLTQTDQFPQIENVEEQFFPNNFYDVRLRTTYPIYRPEIRIGEQVQAEQLKLAQLSREVSELDLERDVRTAYIQLQQARTAEAIYAEALTFVTEALRTTNSLIRNGSELPVARTRLEAEAAQLDADLTGARLQAANAQALLNYFVGRPADTPVAAEALPPVTATPTGDIQNRPELDQARTALAINDLQHSLEDQYYRPKVSLQLDLGSQDFDFRWNPYLLAGVAFELPIWDNRQHHYRQQQLRAEREATTAQVDYLTESFQLQARTLGNELRADLARYESLGPAVTAAERTLRDTERLYREGSANYLNLVDARTQLTRARLRQSIALHTAWLRYVELQRTLAE
jgi:outer membrane protein TolC